ncbi:hypothetical protein [Arcobacter sp.]|uniref:hypothetical protein n=1 Tax=Arcobacter sp. TaxID=1872629 RepID=UPI003D0CF036
MLETINEALETVELRSEVILVNEIIDNINDSMKEKSNCQEAELNNNTSLGNLESINNESIIINNNSGQISNVNGHSSINVSQTTNVRHKRFISNNYKYIGED